MPLWIPVTISAALFQCWRTAMQQKLRHLLSVNGAGFVRFLYGAPTALVLFIAALPKTGLPVPAPNAAFVLNRAAGGLTQIGATNAADITVTWQESTGPASQLTTRVILP